ncbi:MAG: excinuclease ABC subunit UvrA [Paludibacteraceae bacterium]|nr:excinuclease ABC subunit UvrA [Paludibacteraceae bacterium]
MKKESIHIVGARTHNLRNISLHIPQEEMTVVTGVSGSGKSSLAFDTLYAEGQRRYVESLSAYARQFLGRMQKPDVDKIDNIPPAIAIEQKTTSRNPRSTVGTVTEIYDYLKLLFARIGRTISPISGEEVKRHTIRDVVDAMSAQEKGSRIYLLSPLFNQEQKPNKEKIAILQEQGFSRLWKDGETLRISDLMSGDKIDSLSAEGKDIYLMVDRIVADGEQATANRFADSVQTAFFEGQGACRMEIETPSHEKRTMLFSERFEADGIRFIEPSEHLFDFNNPLGACPTCGGYGNVIGIDPDLVVPDKSKSVYEGAIACWRGEKMSQWNDELLYNASEFNFPIHTPYYALTQEQKDLLWKGNRYFHGLNDFFRELESKQYSKLQYRVMLARYRGKSICPDCMGMRLRKEATYVQVGGKSIIDLCRMPISELKVWFDNLILNSTDQQTADRLLQEIKNRLTFMHDVGLNYLTLNRMSNTLSGGESQRINLAKSLGSSLVGLLYVLDEPSIGLHPRDTHRLIHVLRQLRDLGNTIVVVEHDDEIQRAADHIVEIGPGAGTNGGKITYEGKPQLEKFTYDIPDHRRPWNNYIEVVGATENNLKNLTVRFPLGVMTVVTGVSGSGKSSLVSKVLYPALKKHYDGVAERTGDFGRLQGSLHLLKDIEFIDQNPLSRSSRSNPVTYLKAYDEIRRLFASQQLSLQMGFTPAHFSFNTPGGRCEECQGEGTITISMQFMADIVMECEHCHGKRFKQDILDVHYRGKNIYDVLQMTVNEAIDFFSEDVSCNRIVQRLRPLQDVGIGYIRLGQSSSTLSGGESQRVKLASFLAEENSLPTMFVFDEPTTGLHHTDIRVLLLALNRLISRGHTVLIIEHNPEIILSADHVIDLGPEGGNEGGSIVATGTPEDIMNCEKSYTGQCLKQIIENAEIRRGDIPM